MMAKIWIVILIFDLACVWGSLLLEQPSSEFQTRKHRSIDSMSSLAEAARSLDVLPANDWGDYMEPPTTTGTGGAAQVSRSTISSVMATWSIPEQFRHDAVKRVSLLLLAASEGSYSAEAFEFSAESGASLTTLLVVTKKASQPADPHLPYAVIYVTINTNAVLKQLYTQYYAKECGRCIGCLWVSDCCCENKLHRTPRGHAVEEINLIRRKMKADQYFWFTWRYHSQSNVIPLSSLATIDVSNHYPGVGTLTAQKAALIDPRPSATYFNSGGFAPEYVQLQLPDLHSVTSVCLQIAQNPNGHTSHRLYVGPLAINLPIHIPLPSLLMNKKRFTSPVKNSWQLASELHGVTTDHQWINLTYNPPLTSVRFLRLQTLSSPSWVAWKKFLVYGV